MTKEDCAKKVLQVQLSEEQKVRKNIEDWLSGGDPQSLFGRDKSKKD